MSNYTLEVEQSSDGDYYIVLPDEIIEDLGWEEGDVLEWQVRGNGFVLSRINDPDGYQVIEE